VEEIIRSLIERGDLQHDGGVWRTSLPVAEITVPDTLQGLIMERIDRLPDETKHVVQAAAAIGRTFLYRVLLAMSENTDSLDADLSHLERRELIHERTREPEVEYTFKHALTQEVAYESLLASRRAELHRRVGEALERIFGDRLAEYYSILADHFRKGEAWSKAAEYHRKAGAHASQIFAAEADNQYAEAVGALRRLTPITRDTRRRLVDVTIELCRENLLGRAGMLTDTYLSYLRDAEVHEAYLAGVRGLSLESLKGTTLASFVVNQPPLNRKRLAHVQAWLGRAYYRQGDIPTALDYVDAVQRTTREVGDGSDELAVAPATALAPMLLVQGYFNKVEAVVSPATVSRLERDGRWLEWVHANGWLASALAGQGRFREGLARAQVGTRRSANLGGRTLMAIAHNYLSYVLLLGGEDERAAEESERSGELGGDIPQALHLGFALTVHGWALHNLQRPSESKARLDRADELDRVFRDWRDAVRAEQALSTEGAEQAARRAKAVVTAAGRRSSIFAVGHAQRTWARALDASDAARAEVDAHLRESVKSFSDGACHIEVARTHQQWGRIGLERGDPSAHDHLVSAADAFDRAGLAAEHAAVRRLLDA
jgi:tetratricopeptide (TPR) repeat protein